MNIKRLTASSLVLTLLLSMGSPDSARAAKNTPVFNLQETAWLFSGDYRIRAKRAGIDDSYGLSFLVDFFDDGTFTLQCFPLQEDDVFFSGTWEQKKRKTFLSFDAISLSILTDIFEVDFEEGFGEPGDVFIKKWFIKAKLTEDPTGAPILNFKEKIRHKVFWDGIPIKMITNGNGSAGLF